MNNIIPLIAVMFVTQMGFLGFMWNRIDKRFDRLEQKIDTLFEKYAEMNKRTALLEKAGQ